MRVFEACITIFKRHVVSFIIYFGIFMALAVALTALNEDQFTYDFSATKPFFTVINRDSDSCLSEGLISFLRENGNEVVLEDDRSTLQDATFFRATDYVVFLPKGFSDMLTSGNHMTLETVKTTHSADGYFIDSLVNQYLNQVRVYLAAGGDMTEDEVVEAVLSDLALEAVAEKRQFGDSAPLDTTFKVYSQMTSYILLVLVVLCVTNITLAFRRPDLRMRNLCAPVRPTILSAQQLLCCAILSFAAWLLLSVVGLLFFGAGLGEVDIRSVVLVHLNSLVFSIVALSLATLTGSFVRSANSQNAVANVIALGLCFLGGVFVPLDMLGDGILEVSRFLPTYWYVTALDNISALTSYNAGAMLPVWQAMLIQLAFAAAIFCVSLGLGKHLGQSERYFNSIRTEMEA